MVSELDTGRCANEEAKPGRGVDTRRCTSKDAKPQKRWIGGSHIDWRRYQVPARTLGHEGRWIVRSHIDWGGERNIIYKGVKTFT